MRSAWAAVIVALATAGAQGQQIAKLTADDAAEGDEFGSRVSLSGDTAVIGAPLDYDAGFNSGSAYVFCEVGDVWQQIAKLTGKDTAVSDLFGGSVSVDGDTAVIGAAADDDGGDASGSAYVFREDGGVWQQIAKLTANDAAAGDRFGVSVSIDGDTIIVGSQLDSHAGLRGGSAYVFREVGGMWQQIAKLTADDAANGDDFGQSVSIDGDTAVIGAWLDDDACPGFHGCQSGSAYVFREVGTEWQQIAKLTAADAALGDVFGVSVSVSASTAIIGAVGDDDADSASGSAYIFREVGGVWQQVVKITAEDAEESDGFGTSVSLNGDTAIVGAVGDSDAGLRSGSVYIFRKLGDVWQQVDKLTAVDASLRDEFGVSVSISGDMAVVGARLDDDTASGSGSAYIFGVGAQCPADFNADGVLDFFDVSAFLNAYSAGEPAADFNADGRHDFFDLQTFLQAFSAGCP